VLRPASRRSCDLPIEQSRYFELVVNMKAAKAMGADRVIE
jgi:hypothetical protein